MGSFKKCHLKLHYCANILMAPAKKCANTLFSVIEAIGLFMNPRLPVSMWKTAGSFRLILLDNECADFGESEWKCLRRDFSQASEIANSIAKDMVKVWAALSSDVCFDECYCIITRPTSLACPPVHKIDSGHDMRPTLKMKLTEIGASLKGSKNNCLKVIFFSILLKRVSSLELMV